MNLGEFKLDVIRKENNLDVLKTNLRTLYDEFDNASSSTAKATINKFISACESRITELARREKYLM